MDWVQFDLVKRGHIMDMEYILPKTGVVALNIASLITELTAISFVWQSKSTFLEIGFATKDHRNLFIVFDLTKNCQIHNSMIHKQYL